MDRPRSQRVLKFDGAFGPEGGGIALSGDEYKVDVTGLAFCITWHDKHSVIGRYARLPLSDCAGLLHGKGGGAATKGGNAEMVPEVYDSLFFPHIPRFPLRWQGNWIHRGEKRPANPVTRFPVGEMPRRGKRVYKVEHRSGTPSLSRPPIGGLCHLGFLPLDMPAV